MVFCSIVFRIRTNAIISICLTRSRVNPSWRPISTSVLASSPSSPNRDTITVCSLSGNSFTRAISSVRRRFVFAIHSPQDARYPIPCTRPLTKICARTAVVLAASVIRVTMTHQALSACRLFMPTDTLTPPYTRHVFCYSARTRRS